MFRIDNATSVASLPAIPAAGTEKFFDAGDPSVGRPATDVEAWWFNMITEELRAILIEAGITPDKTDNAQVLEAIEALIAAGIVSDALVQGVRGVTIPADYLQARETGGCSAAAVLETTTNKANFRYREFDHSVQNYGQFGLVLPKSWNAGTVRFRVSWSHPAATTFGTAWSLAGLSLGDGDLLDAAFGTAVVVTDAGGTTDKQYWTAWSDPVTIANAAKSEKLLFELSRVVGDAGDNLDVVARFHELEIQITLNAGDDS